MPGSGLYTFENIAVSLERDLTRRVSPMVFAVLLQQC